MGAFVSPQTTLGKLKVKPKLKPAMGHGLDDNTSVGSLGSPTLRYCLQLVIQPINYVN